MVQNVDSWIISVLNMKNIPEPDPETGGIPLSKMRFGRIHDIGGDTIRIFLKTPRTFVLDDIDQYEYEEFEDTEALIAAGWRVD